MSTSNDALKGKKILVVDDTPSNIDVLSQTLEPEGYKIFVASTGEDALKLVTQVTPDLILLDIMLPGIDGFETCRQIKADESTQSIPVIFLTAKHEAEDIVHGLALGGVDYITKPFRHEEVCARIRTHLERTELLQQLETSNRELLELNDLKNKFLGMASHDLRNPLTTIHGFSKMLLSNDSLDDATRRDFLETIHEVSQNMLDLLNDLLDVSIIESGKLNLKPIEGSLLQLVKERIRIFKVFAEKKNISIETRLDPLPAFAFDANRMGQVVDNLLSNALKYSPPDTTIVVCLETHGENACFSVKDEGPGISEKDQAKLFKHFQKLSAQPTGGESSSGLGLAIAKRMVEAHQGSLTVESELGSGATFRFEIPMRD